MVGAHTMYKLTAQGKKIRAIYRTERAITKAQKVFDYYPDGDVLFAKIEWCKADITDIPALETAFVGITHVYHIAAMISFDEKEAKKMYKVNCKGTANIVNLSIAHQVEKIAYVSSIATISKTVGKDSLDETDEFNLMHSNYSYAITKNGAEMEVWRAAQEGVKVLIVNPGVILGPGFWNEGSGKLFSMVMKGNLFYTRGVSGFVGVNDVADALISGMNSNISEERFVLVSENLSFKEVFDLIAVALQKKKPRLVLSAFMAEIGWRISWLKSKLTFTKNSFTKQAARSSNNKTYYNAGKIKKELNFAFTPIATVVRQTAAFLIDDNKSI